ncbi:MAG: phosphatase PAP2 family protein [Bacteroidota bacterium]
MFLTFTDKIFLQRRINIVQGSCLFKLCISLLFPWATLIAYSRVYLGFNYPSDVLVPIIIGVVLGFLFGWIYCRFKPKKRTDKT